MGEFRIVAEQDERRREGRNLGGVHDLEAAMVELRRRVHGLGVLDDLVQNRGGDAARAGLVRLLDRRKDLLDAPARRGGDEDDLGVIDELKPLAEVGLKVLLLKPLGREIPFVDDDHDALPGV